jgi:hypothetical protein
MISGVKKMAAEIALCNKLWKYRSKKSLPQMAHLCRRKLCSIAIGKPALQHNQKVSGSKFSHFPE